ncbi:MAG TPA: hypothetical protein DC049_17350 [Spirochaetia bacterium]|nr:hypothetical protein [Spirochaetia bacterium]
MLYLSVPDYNKNLAKTLEIIDTVFTLKAAWLEKTHPQWSCSDVKKEIYQGIIRRKEEQWKSQKAFLNH